MLYRYILEGQTPVKEPDLLKWGIWIEGNAGCCRVNRDTATVTVDGENVCKITVSTVFLGINYGTEENPLLFETRVFGGPLDGEQIRTATWEEAEASHQEMIGRVKEATQNLKI